MKIIYISTFYGANLGGAEVSVRLIFEELAKKNISIQILTREKTNGQNIKIIPFLNMIPRSIFKIGFDSIDRIAENMIKKIVKKEKPDLIHVHDIFILPSIVNISKEFNIPLVITIRDPLPKKISHNYNIMIRLVSTYFLNKRNEILINNIKKSDKIIAISYFIKDLLIKQGISDTKIDVIYNLPPYWSTDGNIDMKKDNTESFLILFAASRLYEEKGMHILIGAINKVVKKGITNIKLIIAGEGPQKKELEQMSDIYNIRKYVEFIGQISHDKIKEFYVNCDIILFPSIYTEPLGRVAIEAGIVGKPIIATNIGGIPEIVDDKITGLLVPPRDIENLSDAIIELVNNKDLRERLGKNARVKITRKFEPGHIVNQHIQLYKELVENRLKLVGNK